MRHLYVVASFALAACGGVAGTEQQDPGGAVASEPGPAPVGNLPSASTGAAAGAAEQTAAPAIPETPTEAPFANLANRRSLSTPVAVTAADLQVFEDSANSVNEVIKGEYSPVWAEERKAFRAMEEAVR